MTLPVVRTLVAASRPRTYTLGVSERIRIPVLLPPLLALCACAAVGQAGRKAAETVPVRPSVPSMDRGASSRKAPARGGERAEVRRAERTQAGRGDDSVSVETCSAGKRAYVV